MELLKRILEKRHPLLPALIFFLSILSTGCDLDVTTIHYFCVVSNDTILIPNDSTGIQCAPVDSVRVPK